VNSPPVRFPRLKILADGLPLGSAMSARAIGTNNYGPDRFFVSVHCSSGDLGDADSVLACEGSIIEILVSLDAGANYRSLVLGRADSVKWDYRSRTVRLDGRDRSADLQDAPTNETFVNRTSSEIATILALRHGLLPNVVPTSILAGRFFRNDTNQVTYNQFSRSATEWDLLTALARQESYDVFVQGNALHFQPSVLDLVPILTIKPGDTIDLQLRRRLRLSGDIIVTVRSWSLKQSQSVVQSAVSRRVAAPANPPSAQHFSMVQPNLSAAEAARLVIARANEVSRHEQTIEITMPGELSLGPRSIFSLQGTGSEFDQLYQVDTIQRSISTTKAFVQRVTAHSVSTRETFLLT
jgi:phage protein D